MVLTVNYIAYRILHTYLDKVGGCMGRKDKMLALRERNARLCKKRPQTVLMYSRLVLWIY